VPAGSFVVATAPSVLALMIPAGGGCKNESEPP
jgi:hypothetical protein